MKSLSYNNSLLKYYCLLECDAVHLADTYQSTRRHAREYSDLIQRRESLKSHNIFICLISSQAICTATQSKPDKNIGRGRCWGNNKTDFKETGTESENRFRLNEDT
jgi:hypothetical protein